MEKLVSAWKELPEDDLGAKREEFLKEHQRSTQVIANVSLVDNQQSVHLPCTALLTYVIYRPVLPSRNGSTIRGIKERMNLTTFVKQDRTRAFLENLTTDPCDLADTTLIVS